MTDKFILNSVLKKAADRNILIFDVHAGAGVLTERLVMLMKVCFGRNCINAMTFLFVSPQAMKSLTKNDDKDKIIEGVNVIKLDEALSIEIQNHLERFGCVPALAFDRNHLQNDKEFAVASNKNIFNMYDDDCECLLGSF